MGAGTFGVVDLGSNTVHLLVARTDGAILEPLVDLSAGLRLGGDVDRDGMISPAKLEELLGTLRQFAALATEAGVERLQIMATQALRVATNRAAVVAAITDATGLGVIVLTAEQEAALGFRGALADWPGTGIQVVVDIGGGSMQVAVGTGETMHAHVSLPLGAARVAGLFLTSDPPTAGEEYGLRAYLGQVIPPALPRVGGPIAGALGVGGALRRIPLLLGQPVGTLLPADAPEQVAAQVRGRPAADLVATYALPPERAHLVFPAALLLAEVLRGYGQPPLAVVASGVREGAILNMGRYGTIERGQDL